MRRWSAAACGVAAVLCGAGVGEAVAAVTGALSPIGAVGDAIIDASPGWLKEFAISVFGTADKVVLVVAVCLTMLGLGAVAGLLEARRPPIGRVVVAAAAAAGVATILGRPDATPFDTVPAILAGLLAVVALGLLIRRAHAAAAAPAAAGTAGGSAVADVSRRRECRQRVQPVVVAELAPVHPPERPSLPGHFESTLPVRVSGLPASR